MPDAASPLPPSPPPFPPPPPPPLVPLSSATAGGTQRRRAPAGCVILFIVVALLCVGSGLVFTLFGGAILAGSHGSDRLTEKFIEGDESSDNKILRLEVHGAIMPSGGGLFSLVAKDPKADLRKQLRKAGEDSSVKAILLDIDSPGGAVTECDVMYEEILRWKKEHKGIPVVALFGDMAASGGYYLGSAADWIVCHPSTLTGSIGVILSYTNFEELMKKYGVKEVTYKSGAKKDLISMSRMPTPEEEALLQGVVMDMYGRFLNVVAAGREGKAKKLTLEQIRALADGSVFTGGQALANGLVDQIGYLDDALAKVRSLAGVSKAKLVEYRPTEGLAALMQNRAGGVGPEAALAAELHELVAEGTPRVLYLWRGR